MTFTAPPAFVFVDGHAPILFSHCADLSESRGVGREYQESGQTEPGLRLAVLVDPGNTQASIGILARRPHQAVILWMRPLVRARETGLAEIPAPRAIESTSGRVSPRQGDSEG